jgi:site-specific DNA-methyltransferase (adenine-specific)
MTTQKPYYEHAGITIWHGDCLDIIERFEDDLFDAVVTDPPYSSGGRVQATARNNTNFCKDPNRGGRHRDEWFLGDNMGVDTYFRWMRQVSRECLRCVNLGGHGYVFTDWRQYTNLVTAWESVGWTLRSVIVWDKKKHSALGSFWRNNHEWICVFAKGQPRKLTHYNCYNTWTGGKPKGGVHPTIKPIGLMRYIIKAIPKSSGIILDPFMGSGTTLRACKENEFRSVGIERNEKYIETAINELKQDMLPFGDF